MSNELYIETYNYVRKALLDPTYGLMIKYADMVFEKETIEKQNRDTLSYMSVSTVHEKAIIDRIIEVGLKNVQAFQYPVTLNNLKRFLTPSRMNILAREAYLNVLSEMENKQRGL